MTVGDAAAALTTRERNWLGDQGQAQIEQKFDRLVAEVERLQQAQRRVPSDEGGPGNEEHYWMRAKLGAAIMHLRDLEDFYRLRGGTPAGFNQVRADRARQLYEAITEDFLNGSMTRPTTRERADQAGKLRAALDTIDWLLHVDRHNPDPKRAEQLTHGESIKRDVIELARAALADSDAPPTPAERET